MFLKWWIVFALILFGMSLAAVTGLVETVNRADVTKLSFVILGVFTWFSIRVGKMIWGTRDTISLRVYARFIDSAKFASRILIDLGMIGTVIGFIYMLSLSFKGIEVATSANFKIALQTMGTGMGTALWTTAMGLICSVLLRIQLYPLEQYLRGRL